MSRREPSPDRVSQVSSWNPGPTSHRESTLDAAESRPAVSVGDREDFLDAPNQTSVSFISAAGGESMSSRPHTEHTVENAPDQQTRPTDDEIIAQENKIRSIASVAAPPADPCICTLAML